MLPWPSDCSIRRLTRALVISARITVLRVTPAMIRRMPKTCIPVDWWAKEKSPKPTVAKVSIVK